MLMFLLFGIITRSAYGFMPTVVSSFVLSLMRFFALKRFSNLSLKPFATMHFLSILMVRLSTVSKMRL